MSSAEPSATVRVLNAHKILHNLREGYFLGIDLDFSVYGFSGLKEIFNIEYDSMHGLVTISTSNFGATYSEHIEFSINRWPNVSLNCLRKYDKETNEWFTFFSHGKVFESEIKDYRTRVVTSKDYEGYVSNELNYLTNASKYTTVNDFLTAGTGHLISEIFVIFIILDLLNELKEESRDYKSTMFTRFERARKQAKRNLNPIVEILSRNHEELKKHWFEFSLLSECIYNSLEGELKSVIFQRIEDEIEKISDDRVEHYIMFFLILCAHGMAFALSITRLGSTGVGLLISFGCLQVWLLILRKKVPRIFEIYNLEPNDYSKWNAVRKIESKKIKEVSQSEKLLKVG